MLSPELEKELSSGEVAMVPPQPWNSPSTADHNSHNSLNSQATKVVKRKPQLHADALYGVAGDTLQAIEPYTEASVPAMLIQLLSAFGIMVNKAPYFEHGRVRHYLKIFFVLVGPTGSGRKGTSWSEIISLMGRVNEDFGELVTSGLSSGEGLISHVRDPQFKSRPVKENGRITDYEEEMIDDGAKEKRLLVIESEFSRVLKVAGREGNVLSEVIRDAFDKDSLRVMTKVGLKASGVHVAVGGHITGHELMRELDETSKANGFGNRFQWVWTERSKMLAFGGDMPDSVLNDVVTRLHDAFRFALTINKMTRTPEADALWVKIYEAMDQGYSGMMEALTSRGTDHITRMACIYALLDKSCYVDVPHLKAALAMWRYSEDSALYIFGNATGDKTQDLILSFLEEAPDGLGQTDISNLLGRHTKADELNGALRLLTASSRIGFRKEGGAGRTRTVYFILTDAN